MQTHPASRQVSQRLELKSPDLVFIMPNQQVKEEYAMRRVLALAAGQAACVFRISPTSYYSITSVGPQVPAANTSVCLIKRDQTQLCAYVLNSFYRMGPDGNYSDGPIIQMDRDVAIGGDSGGPWLYGGVAYGIHSGNNEYPVGTKRDVFTPAASLPRMGLSVVTQ